MESKFRKLLINAVSDNYLLSQAAYDICCSSSWLCQTFLRVSLKPTQKLW